MLEPEVILKIIDTSLKQNVIFGDLITSENKSFLAHNSLIRPAEPGLVLCQQGQFDKSIFLIISGEAEVTMEFDGRTTWLAKPGTGDLVGEISGLFLMPHIATVTVTQPSILLEIPSEVFLSMLDANQGMRNTINRRCKERIIENSLRCVPELRKLDQGSFSELCYLSSLLTAKKGAILAQEGKIERSIYVIYSGIVRVFITVNGEEITIAILRPGDYFGEYSCFTGKARTASVSALAYTRLVVLEGEAFQSFVDYYEEVESELNQKGLQRKQLLDRFRDDLISRQTAEQRMTQIQDMFNNLNL